MNCRRTFAENSAVTWAPVRIAKCSLRPSGRRLRSVATAGHPSCQRMIAWRSARRFSEQHNHDRSSGSTRGPSCHYQQPDRDYRSLIRLAPGTDSTRRGSGDLRTSLRRLSRFGGAGRWETVPLAFSPPRQFDLGPDLGESRSRSTEDHRQRPASHGHGGLEGPAVGRRTARGPRLHSISRPVYAISDSSPADSLVVGTGSPRPFRITKSAWYSIAFILTF
jgi:hypothetical protein